MTSTTSSPSTREDLLAEIERQARTLGLSETDLTEVIQGLRRTSTPVLQAVYHGQVVEMARRIAEAAGGRQ